MFGTKLFSANNIYGHMGELFKSKQICCRSNQYRVAGDVGFPFRVLLDANQLLADQNVSFSNIKAIKHFRESLTCTSFFAV